MTSGSADANPGRVDARVSSDCVRRDNHVSRGRLREHAAPRSPRLMLSP
jgi:hypothetical protein